MKNLLISIVFSIFLFIPLFNLSFGASERPGLTQETESCLGCHPSATPGIVKDWLSSRHANTTPEDALKLPVLERRISAKDIPDNINGKAVGCYECHSLNPANHRDNFEHFGFRINVIVSPNDCKTCHPVEVNQYSNSKKAHAIKNLMDI